MADTRHEAATPRKAAAVLDWPYTAGSQRVGTLLTRGLSWLSASVAPPPMLGRRGTLGKARDTGLRGCSGSMGSVGVPLARLRSTFGGQVSRAGPALSGTNAVTSYALG